MFNVLKNSHPHGDTVSIKYDYVSHPGVIHSPLFSELYGVYKTGFPHGCRQPDFFARMFALNHNRRVQAQWGLTRYEIAYAHSQGKIVGTAMYNIIAAPRSGWPDSPYHVAVGIDYRSVLPEARGRGIAGEFERIAVKRAISKLELLRRIRHRDEANVLVFNEMARPLAMPFADFADDVRLAKTNPFDRVATWNKAGLLRVMPSQGIPLYIEPASLNGDPRCDYYSINIKTEGKSIGAKTIENIVLRYAALRRMDGGNPCQDQAFAAMINQIKKKVWLTPVEDAEHLKPFRQYADALLGRYPGPIPPDVGARSLGSLIHQNFGLVVPSTV